MQLKPCRRGVSSWCVSGLHETGATTQGPGCELHSATQAWVWTKPQDNACSTPFSLLRPTPERGSACGSCRSWLSGIRDTFGFGAPSVWDGARRLSLYSYLSVSLSTMLRLIMNVDSQKRSIPCGERVHP